MNDTLDSVREWFKERTTSPLYGTFIFSVILWNWKFFYILFWQAEEKLSLPRIEYVQQNILKSENLLKHFLSFLILPAISTYFIVWWLPILSNWAHKKHTVFYYKRKFIVDDARIKYETQEKDNLISISTIKKEQAEVKKEIEENTSEEDKWAAEFELIKSHPIFSRFREITDLIYSNGGKTHKIINNAWTRVISTDALAFADTRGLIQITNDTSQAIQEKINLTKKGKFFAAKIY
jgi:hypothetical protein